MPNLMKMPLRAIGVDLLIARITDFGAHGDPLAEGAGGEFPAQARTTDNGVVRASADLSGKHGPQMTDATRNLYDFSDFT